MGGEGYFVIAHSISLGEEFKNLECVPQDTGKNKIKEPFQVTPSSISLVDATTPIWEALLPEGSIELVAYPKSCIV
jgi:hypothetical protein